MSTGPAVPPSSSRVNPGKAAAPVSSICDRFSIQPNSIIVVRRHGRYGRGRSGLRPDDTLESCFFGWGIVPLVLLASALGVLLSVGIFLVQVWGSPLLRLVEQKFSLLLA